MNTTTDLLNINQIDKERRASRRRFTLDLDLATSGVWVLRFDAESGTGIAASEFSGQLYAFRVSGTTCRGGMVRAAAYALRDVSLAAGTVQANLGERYGARVNDLFLSDPELAEHLIG